MWSLTHATEGINFSFCSTLDNSFTVTQVGLIQFGLLLPQGEPNLTDLQVARKSCFFNKCPDINTPRLDLGDILEIGAFCSIRARDVPSFDRYFSQLQTFYTDFG